MPIYEYRCKKCGVASEYLISLSEEETIFCKTCGSSDLERIMSAATFLGKTMERKTGHTCCGREEHCEAPPCSTGGVCRRD
jgi:putative FmdB family regulatory protein